MDFLEQLVEKGWKEVKHDWEYRKGKWVVFRDTSSWFEVGTEDNPRVFDVHSPKEFEIGWTINLIEHLCKMEDERIRLRQALTRIANGDKSPRDVANAYLAKCYHTWLVEEDGEYKYACPICGSETNGPNV